MQQTIQFECIPVEFVVRFIRYVYSKSSVSNNHFYFKFVLLAALLWKSFPELKERNFARLRYCNSTANLSTLRYLTNQSMIPESVWYHGTAASKACLQDPPPFPPSQTTAYASLASIFLVSLHFLSFFPTAEPCPRLECLRLSDRNSILMTWNLSGFRSEALIGRRSS